MIRWIFTPVHSVIKMTPLTCVTTALCCFLGGYFTWVEDDLMLAMMKGVFAALVIGLLNLGVHEVAHKWLGPKAVT